MRKTTFPAAAIAVLLLACGDDGTGPAPEPKLTSIVISPADPVLADGATLALEVALRDEKGATMSLPQGATLTWSSSDADVASVSGDGTLTANSPGTAMIRAAVGTVQDEIEVTVTQAPTELVVVSGEAQEAFAGEALPAPIVVEVRDRHGAPVEGIEVAFSVEGGSVTPESTPSDEAGQVSVAWTLGDAPGEQTLTVSTMQPALGPISITATALDPAVADLTAGLPADSSTLVLYKFDEAEPGTSVDATGNGHDGVDHGTTVISGPWGGAREFNGVDDRIDISAIQVALQKSTTFTIEIISRSPSATTAPGLIGHDCSNGLYLLASGANLQTNLKTTGYTAGLCPWYSGTFGSEKMPRRIDRNWHHYALVWDGAEMRSYRDGVLLGARPVTGTFSGVVSSGTWIGYNSHQSIYDAGQIDEIRVSTIARDSAELASNWKGLTLNWPRITAVSVAVSGDSLTLTGSNLGDVSTVYIGDIEAPIAEKTPTQISVQIPAEVDDGTHDVLVETNDGRWGIKEVVLER